jgi:ABC-2 type transport system ATP-binding protein
MAESDSVVSVCGLQKGFGDGDVLSDVDLEIPGGKITLLMGPNGAGKTILLSCIAGGLYADSGEIAVFGETPDAAAESLSFMLQDAMLVDELTGEENVSFFRDLHPQSTDQLEEVLDTLDFEMDALAREVGDYSGGMKRKLELAISLSVDVPLYLLDEPTAALDMTTVESLHSLLAKRRAAGETVLISSHLPTDAELADYVAFVTEEGVSAVRPPEELLAEVPTVVLAEGTTDITENVREGRLFDGEIYRRGFLQEGTNPETVTSGTDAIQVREPTYLDMFNYYIHLRNGWDE